MIRSRLTESLAGYGATATLEPRLESFIASPLLGNMAGPLGALALARSALDPIGQLSARNGKADPGFEPFI